MFVLPTKPSLYRDFALLSVLIVFVLFLVSVWIVVKTYQSYSDDILEKLEHEAVRIDRTLIIEIERAAYLLESIARQIDTEKAVDTNNINRLFYAYRQSDELNQTRFDWINRDQDVVIRSDTEQLEKPINVSDRDYMKRALTSPWNMHIGQPVQDPVSNRWYMPLVMGITNESGRFMGAVSIQLDINALSGQIREVLKSEYINFAITNQAFTLLTEDKMSADYFHEHFSISALSAIDFAASPRGVFSFAEVLHHHSIYAYYETSSKYPYIIFVGYDGPTSRSDIFAILIPRLLQILIITLFLVLTLWTVRKRIIKPVLELKDSTTAILSGKSFTHDSSRDPVEVELLSKEIGRLYHYIAERKRIGDELINKNAELMHWYESVKQTNRLKADFFEQISTILAKPIQSIRDYNESLQREIFGPIEGEQYHEILGQIENESLSMNILLDDLLVISHAQSEMAIIQKHSVDLTFLMQKTMRLIQETHHLNDQSFVIEAQATSKLWVDEKRIEQLFANLLTHIVIHHQCGRDEPIRITTQQSDHSVIIECIFQPAGKNVLQEGPDERNAKFNDYVERKKQWPEGIIFSAELNRILCELILDMHQGSMETKTTYNQRMKTVITLPQKHRP